MPEPVIETLEDWNFRLGQCDCCGMPICPTPTMESESLSSYASVDYAFYDTAGLPYSTRIETAGPTPAAVSETSDQYNPGYVYNFSITGPTYVSYTFASSDGRTSTQSFSPQLRTVSCGNDISPVFSTVKAGSYGSYESSTSGYANSENGGFNFQTNTTSTTAISIFPGTGVTEGQWVATRNITSNSVTSDDPWTFVADPPTNETYYGQGLTQPTTYTYEDPIALDAAKTKAFALSAAATFDACEEHVGHGSSSLYEHRSRPIDGAGDFILRAWADKVRYRWRIPSIHAGTYFKITWDVLEEPEGWDIAPPVSPVEPETVSAPGAEPVRLITNPSHAVWEDNAEAWAKAWYPPAAAPPYPVDEPSEQITNPDYTTWLAADAAYNSYLADHAAYLADVVVYDEAVIAWDAYIEDHPEWVARPRSLVSQDNVVVWAGPGNAEDPDDASWFSGWYDLDPPAELGAKSVVNIRFECYGVNDYGNKPQVTGEAYEIPD